MRKYIYIPFILTMFLLVGCNGDDEDNVKKETTEDSPMEIVYATNQDAAGLSPIDNNHAVTNSVTLQVFETLFVWNSDSNESEPLLAESFSNPDENTWEIKLKEGIEFHDGTPFNAEAVKYTFDEILDSDRAAPQASLLKPISEIIVEDEYTLTFKTEKPYGEMLLSLSHPTTAIISPKADKEGDIDTEPVGTGPFVFEEWNPGEHIIINKNENYWRDPAELDKFTYKIVPEEASAISMLEAGEIDMIDRLTPDLLPRVESLKGVTVVKEEGIPLRYIIFNMEKEPFNDLKFRQAVAHAIDQETYVEQVHGLGVHNENFLGPGRFGYDEEADKVAYEYNPEKAKELLKDTEYEGQEITLSVVNDDQHIQIGEIVQPMLAEVGIDLKIESIEAGVYGDVAGAGDFEMSTVGLTSGAGDGSEVFSRLYSDNIGATNFSRYSDEKFDKLVKETEETLDPEEREEKLQELNTLAVKASPWIIMRHSYVVAAYLDNIEGVTLETNGSWRLYDVVRK